MGESVQWDGMGWDGMGIGMGVRCEVYVLATRRVKAGGVGGARTGRGICHGGDLWGLGMRGAKVRNGSESG